MSVMTLLLLLVTVSVAPEPLAGGPVAEPVMVEATDVAETTLAEANVLRREGEAPPTPAPDGVRPFRPRPSPPDRPPEA